MSTFIPKKITGVFWDEEPKVQFVRGATSDKLRLVQDWVVYIKLIDGTIIKLVILAGFRFEGSVPAWAWTITRVTNVTPEALPGWCLHDFLYILVKLKLVDREEADTCLKFALADRFNFAQITAVYGAVRTCGWYYAAKPITEEENREATMYIKTLITA